jgi:hypothetical protein
MEDLRIGMHIRVDEDTHKEIKEIAKREHRSFSQQARYLIELGLYEIKSSNRNGNGIPPAA